MEQKWIPCACTIILGILIIVFTWIKVSWAAIALTVLGALVILRGIGGNKGCCCMRKKEVSSTCCQ